MPIELVRQKISVDIRVREGKNAKNAAGAARKTNTAWCVIHWLMPVPVKFYSCSET